MISGIMLEQFFVDNTVSKSTINLKDLISHDQNSIQNESLSGFYLLFNQILQNLLNGRQESLDKAAPVPGNKGILIDTNINHFEKSNQEWILDINFLGNKSTFNAITFSNNKGENNRLFNHTLKTTDEEMLVPKGLIFGKHLQGRGDIKDKNFKILNILDSKSNKKDVELSNKDLKISKNPHRIDISKLLSGEAKRLHPEKIVNKKPTIAVEGKIQSDIFQSKGDNIMEEKNDTNSIVRQVILNTENGNKENDSYGMTAKKEGVAKVHDLKVKPDNVHLFQNGGERLNFKVENNNTMQRHVGTDIGLNRLQEVEIVKDTPKPQSLNLVLETEGLGKIALRVAVHNHLVRADFVAEHINSIIHIQSNLSDLFSSLYREGLMPEDFSFYLGDNNRESHKDQYKDRTVASMDESKLKIKEGIRNQLYNVSIKV